MKESLMLGIFGPAAVLADATDLGCWEGGGVIVGCWGRAEWLEETDGTGGIAL